MNENPKEILIALLNLLELDYNKEELAEEFILICNKQAILKLIEKLSEERQQELIKRLEGDADFDRRESIIKEFFSEEDYNIELQKASQDILSGYLEELVPDLSNTQKEKISQYFSSQ